MIKKLNDITGDEKINIEYSDETKNLKVELTNYIYDEFTKLVKAGIINAKEFNSNMDIVVELVNDISSKASSDGFMQGFRTGHEAGYNNALNHTWEMEESGDYIRFGVRDYLDISEKHKPISESTKNAFKIHKSNLKN